MAKNSVPIRFPLHVLGSAFKKGALKHRWADFVSRKKSETALRREQFLKPASRLDPMTRLLTLKILSLREFFGSTGWTNIMPIRATGLFTFTGRNMRTKSGRRPATVVSGCATQT